MNSGIEMHDSILESCSWIGKDLLLYLDAYLHRSEGNVGVDPGTGWTQSAQIHLWNAKVVGQLPESQARISEGDLHRGKEVMSNVIRLPCEFDGDVRLNLEFSEHPSVAIEASGIRLILTGEATYIEDFPGL